jgi:hypothetical protein
LSDFKTNSNLSLCTTFLHRWWRRPSCCNSSTFFVEIWKKIKLFIFKIVISNFRHFWANVIVWHSRLFGQLTLCLRVLSWNPYWRGSISTLELLVVTQAAFDKCRHYLLYHKTSYLNEEVSTTTVLLYQRAQFPAYSYRHLQSRLSPLDLIPGIFY